jgi:hypothetical protein
MELPNINSTQANKEKQQIDKLKKEREQLQQTLKSAREELDSFKKKVLEQDELNRKLEERIANTQLAQPSPQTAAYPNHAISQSARLTPTYATHNPERTLNPNQAFNNQMAAAGESLRVFLFLHSFTYFIQVILQHVKCFTTTIRKWFNPDGLLPHSSCHINSLLIITFGTLLICLRS